MIIQTKATEQHFSLMLIFIPNKVVIRLVTLTFLSTFSFHFQVYQGPNTKFEYDSLPASTEVRFRVCALRLMNAPNQSPGPIKGVFSSVTSARTMSPRKKKILESSTPDGDLEPKVKEATKISLTDKQWAMVFFSGFSFMVIVVVLLLPSLFGVSD